MPKPFIPSPDYPAARETAARLDAAVAAASKAWNAIDGIGTGPMGLTPDAIKFAPAYRVAKARYDTALTALRRFNQTYTKRFKREIAADRDAARAAKMAALA